MAVKESKPWPLPRRSTSPDPAARSPSVCSDLGVAALSCCLWLTQLISFALAHDIRTLVKSALLLACNLLPLLEGQNWQGCRARHRCLTIYKTMLFALLCWEAGRHGMGPADAGGGGSGLAAPPVAPATSPALPPWLRASGSSNSGSGGGVEHSATCPSSADAAAAMGAGVADAGGAIGLLTALVSESKLFALMHSGLAFRYSRWQHTALSQTVAVAAAAAQTAWYDVCAVPGGTTRHGMRRLAEFLTNCHALPLPWEPAPGLAPAQGSPTGEAAPAGGGSGSASNLLGPSGAAGSGSGGAASPVLLAVPDILDACRLLLTWSQLALGWALPVWAAALGESQARARFAAQHAQQLEEGEKDWAVSTAVGYQWLSALFQFPMLCLILWHLLLAAAAAGVPAWLSSAGG
ncbi:hypothetical protein ABPG75_008503 [Micractinium tetrahymenae]